ncbi:Outer membrane porin F precursor [Methylobrevis pamukkalensis]|uniref:Outer membrane porin F n=2 Tax=Methylobrevis pamukkalensis TaxID=1439726 RepID=A0A1E3GXN7_9HYPH|nr:Outer membrane porin F precursor [Methylobrevis pamukkalensis]
MRQEFEQKEREERRQAERRAQNREVINRDNGRVVIREGDRIIVRSDDMSRFRRNSRDFNIDRLDDGRRRVTTVRNDGVRIVTVYDARDRIVSRTRVRDGRETYLIDNRRFNRGNDAIINFRNVLPPLVIGIPQNEYILDSRGASRAQIEETFLAPPVEVIERPYSLEEVRYSERLRDKVRRIDIDAIHFATGSDEVASDQLAALDNIADAIMDILDERPDEIFLIEGHTDAVGSDLSNLELSDRRAESVAAALSEDYGIPPENLVTQGYGEEDLKVETESASAENRRVTMRRITPLLDANAGSGGDAPQ